ncbi:MAG: rod shape-determining protein RodA [Prolixibacteraceae bacterium]|nr:rod shape-determining protein RodA [Prolixibacteraceae bacterium]
MAIRNNTWGNLDWVTILIYIILVISGWFNIYSAVYNDEFSSIFDLSQRYGKQMIWIGLSAVLAFFILLVDSKFFVTFSYVLYVLFALLLILVLFVGKEVNGAKSWLMLGSLAIQPAEFAKLGTSLAIAKLISSYSFSFNNFRKVLALALLILIPVVLIVLQNDTGSALVYIVFIIPLFREGMSGLILFFVFYAALLFILTLVVSPLAIIVTVVVLALFADLIIRKRWGDLLKIIVLIGFWSLVVWGYSEFFTEKSIDAYYVLVRSSVLASIVLMFVSLIKRIPQAPLIVSMFLLSLAFTFTVDYAFNEILESHHRARINNLIGVESDPLGAGYNVNQSKIAIGSGGLTGKGFLQGTQTKYDFVPEQSTDFIFCTVGEEWGFIGTSAVVIFFIVLIIRLIILAERQRSAYSRIFGYCVASIIFFHFAVNIGMTIGLAPVIGIPLPFFSYGGSSLWFFTILLFVFLKLDSSRFEQLH